MEITFYCKKVIMLVLLLHRRDQNSQSPMFKKWWRTPQIMVDCLSQNASQSWTELSCCSKSLMHQTWGHFYKKRKQNNEKMFTKPAKIQFIKESPYQREQNQTKKEFLADYSCNQFNSECTKQRWLAYGPLSGEPKKSHVANLISDGFRREKLLAILARDDRLTGNSSQVSLMWNCYCCSYSNVLPFAPILW